MGEHFKPGNVIRGNFGRRRAVRSPDNPRSEYRGTGWLSPDAYRALSREEKLALAARRQMRPHNRRYAPRRASWKKGWVRYLILGGVFLYAASTQGLPIPGTPQAMFSPRSAPVTASFSFCHTGGGTNCVVDGDTFYMAGQKIRIADIDAPETHDYGCSSELERGRQASRRLQDLLNSGTVQMASIDRDTDRYGRKLRIVEVNGTGVGETLVGEGLARWYAGGRRSWC